MDDFWEKELAANRTPRKSLDDLCYIQIPLNTLPLSALPDDSVAEECRETLEELSKSPIVNLTGISNTDLKLQYGAPNINLLSSYDQRYTTLARTLQTLGNRLYENRPQQEYSASARRKNSSPLSFCWIAAWLLRRLLRTRWGYCRAFALCLDNEVRSSRRLR